MSLVLQGLSIAVLSWIVWRISQAVLSMIALSGLPGPSRTSWISGNLSDFYSPTGIPWHLEMVKKYGRVFKIYGLLGDEQVYVTDPKALNEIILRDTDTYQETKSFILTNHLMFGDGLLATLGDHHTKQRKLLIPAFSVTHMQNIAPIFSQITHQLKDCIANKVQDGPRELDVYDWVSRAAFEYIGQGGLGYSFGILEDGSFNQYAKAVKDLFPSLLKLSLFRQFLPFLTKLGPRRFRRFLVDLLPSQTVESMKNVIDMLWQSSSDILESKKSALLQGEEAVAKQVGQGKDIMSLLLRANEMADESDRISEREVLGQMTTLIFAAHDTSSSAISRIIQLLVSHPEYQTRLRNEVCEAKARHGELSYHELNALPFLDAVIRETLRMFPPLSTIQRTTSKDTVLPLGTPITSKDGTAQISSIFIKSNTNVIIGIAGAQRDPAIWGEDADSWKPERWVGKNTEEVAREKLPGIFSGTLTFLGGERGCIGWRFALLEIKTVVSTLVESFIFEPSEKEIIWRNSNILTPSTVGREAATPHMPLRVSLVSD